MVECDYGMNLGRSWTINTFPDYVSDFQIKIKSMTNMENSWPKKVPKFTSLAEKDTKTYGLM